MIAVRIQHHPSRAHLLSTLRQGLSGLRVKRICDPCPTCPPETWRTYRACLTAPLSTSTRSVLVVQDDVAVCRGFADQVRAAVDERPDDLVSLYTGAFPELTAIRVRQATDRGERWCKHQGAWVPAVALIWPRGMAMDFAQWAGHDQWHPGYADDARIGHFVRTHQIAVWHRIPNLVDHPGFAPSLVGTKTGSHHRSVAPGEGGLRTRF